MGGQFTTAPPARVMSGAGPLAGFELVTLIVSTPFVAPSTSVTERYRPAPVGVTLNVRLLKVNGPPAPVWFTVSWMAAGTSPWKVALFRLSVPPVG